MTSPEKLATVAQEVYQRGYTTSSGGNLSHRSPSGFWVSATGASFSRQTAAEFSECNLNGEPLSGPLPSKEARFHGVIYRLHPGVNTVLHVHADDSLALSCLAEPTGGNVLPILSSYAVTKVGRVPLIPYFAPGTAELVQAVSDACQGVNAVLMQNHGVLTYAPSLELAVDILEELEQNCRVWLRCQGQCRVLSETELEIANAAAKHGAKVPPGQQRPRLLSTVKGWLS